MLDIKVTKTTSPKAKTPEDKLGFGAVFSDHMFVMDYLEGKGWHDPRIVPYAPLELEPSAVVFHYAQECFEGMKAYRTVDNNIQLFRPEANGARMQNSHRRLCIPEIPVEDFVQAVKSIVEMEKDWVPFSQGSSLYLRPFTIATMPKLSVHSSNAYKFIVICSPSGAYYKEGLAPIKIYVEPTYVRAAPGGTGFVKSGGNYAVSLLAAQIAEEKGYSQVLWLDGIERKYVEEVGAMNIFFKIDGELYTAAASDSDGTVLPGVTRRSIIELLKDWGYKVNEGTLSIDDVMKASREGKLEEVFGSGTAAVVSPVKQLDYEEESAIINNGEIGELTQRLYDTMTGMQWGLIPDNKGWIVPVCKG